MTPKPQLQAGANYVLVYRHIPTLKPVRPRMRVDWFRAGFWLIGTALCVALWAWVAVLTWRHFH